MFVELHDKADDGDYTYPVFVNIERIMWFGPMEKEGSGTKTTLYMNVADDDGKPSELDVIETYGEVKQQLIKGDYYAVGKGEVERSGEQEYQNGDEGG